MHYKTKYEAQLMSLWHGLDYSEQYINGKDSWEANPWVRVLEFIVHSKNIDEVINAKHVQE